MYYLSTWISYSTISYSHFCVVVPVPYPYTEGPLGDFQFSTEPAGWWLFSSPIADNYLHALRAVHPIVALTANTKDKHFDQRPALHLFKKVPNHL